MTPEDAHTIRQDIRELRDANYQSLGNVP